MLKQGIRKDNAGTVHEGDGFGPDAIRLHVPQSLADIARNCEFSARKPVEIQPYTRFNKSLLEELRCGQMILVADLKDYSKAAGSSERQFPIEGVGKLLLMGDEGDMGKYKLPLGRSIDLMARKPEAVLFSFKVNKALTELEYDVEVEALKSTDQVRQSNLEALNEIGMALSTEKDLELLLDLIVSKSRQMTWADAGSLYLIESDPNIPEDQLDYFQNKKMRFQVAQNDSRKVPFKSFVVDITKKSIYGYVALTQEPLNFEDVYHLPRGQEYSWGGKEFDAGIRYRTMSMLTVPMVNWRGETIGVIQLINRKIRPDLFLDDPKTCVKYIAPFNKNDVRMALSIASQASIAIQNTQLVNSIRTLFEGFIDASVKAIESRDPTTSGHSQRVATLTVALAEQVDQSDMPRFRPVRYTREHIQEIRYASLLHDFGKIGVREHVLVKAKKLYPEELQSLQDRFDLIRAIAALRHARKEITALQQAAGNDKQALLVQSEEELARELGELDELLDFISRCNEPTVLAQGGFERLHEIASMRFRKIDEEEVPFLSDKELVSLSVAKGSLTEQDRKEIESHVSHTYKFLSTIPWTSDLRRVPEIAYAHHEKLNGKGYPNRLKEDKIPLQSKMMTISDIFDALTAMDRPYKKALPAERALNILIEEANASHVDKDLLDIFISADIYRLVT